MVCVDTVVVVVVVVAAVVAVVDVVEDIAGAVDWLEEWGKREWSDFQLVRL